MLHLVEFANPGPPVRESAAVFDLCPKNLDVYVRDMLAQFAELRDAGIELRNLTYGNAITPNGIRIWGIHIPAHDAIRVVLLELVGRESTWRRPGSSARDR